MEPGPIRVLLVGIHNVARRQTAAALLRHLGGNACAGHVAGAMPTRVNPFAVRVMAPLNLDSAGARSKHVNEFVGQDWEVVGDDARERCPVGPSDTERRHWTGPDPSAVEGSAAERQRAFNVVAADLINRLRPWIEVTKRVKAGTA